MSSTGRRGVELAAELALLDVGWQRRAMWDAKQEAGVRRVRAPPEVRVGEWSPENFTE